MTPISRNDVVRLLALCAAADQRTVGNEDVMLWHGIAQHQRWTTEAARRAIIEHYAQGADRPRITPAAISDRLRGIRRRAAENFELPRIPDDQPTAVYPTWLRAHLAAHVDAELARWAADGVEPQAVHQLNRPGTRAELEAVAPEHLRAEIKRGFERIGSGAGPNAVPQMPRARNSTPERRAAAYAELASTAPGDVPDDLIEESA